VEAEIAGLQAVVSEVRRFRADQGVKPAQRIRAQIHGMAPAEAVGVRSLLRLDDAGDAFSPTAALTTSTGVRVELDLSGAIDVAAERARLVKALAAAQRDREANAAKLATEAFTAKAPDAVVAKVRDRVTSAEADIARLEAALAALPGE
jgi:valyl-tRNA synthetase